MRFLSLVLLAAVACGGSDQSSSTAGAALAGHWPLSNGAAIDLHDDGGGHYFSAADLALLGTCTEHDSTGACSHFATVGDMGALPLSCSKLTGQDFVLTFNGGAACTQAPAGASVLTLTGHLSGGAFTATLNDAGASSLVSGALTGPPRV